MLGYFRRLLLEGTMAPRRAVEAFYAIRCGRKVGIVRSWAECEQLVKGFPGAKYKKFLTLIEADRFVAGEDDPAPATAPMDMPPSIKPSKSQKRKLSQGDVNNMSLTASNRELTEAFNLKKACFDSAERTNQVEGTTSAGDERLAVVYTDGACSGNGTANAKAGIGVYWGDGDTRNVSEPLEGRPTNNRAEIHAAVTALRQAQAQGFDKLEIRTDSSFLIKAITEWVPGWQRKSWTLTSGKPVINREDFEELLKAQEGIQVIWTHVAGHVGIHGNEMADKLAVKGMNKIRNKSS